VQVVQPKDATKNLPLEDPILVIALTVIATVVRLWRINYPTSVVFDEVHFGGFATKYQSLTRVGLGRVLIVDTSKVDSSWMYIHLSQRC
jgi:hypothetical protein